MTVSMLRSPSKVNLLPHDVGSLAHGLPPAVPETLFVLGAGGGMSVAPDAEFTLTFGRNNPDVHVCVGVGDPHVSRVHGVIVRQYSRWMLSNIGRLPIRLPGSRLVLGGDQAELPTGYTPLFIVGPRQEHLLQVRVSAHAAMPADRETLYEAETRGRTVWDLDPLERLVLVCLSQRYLRNEPQPQPLTWEQVAAELTQVQGTRWTWRVAAHKVAKVRERLSDKVPGLRAKEVQPPVGNALNHNLIMELLLSTSITKADLALLDGPA